MAMGHISLAMERDMKGSSRMVRGMVKASIITKMVMSMKGFTKEI